MRKLRSVTALGNFTLDCVFENGVQKIADINPYLNSEVFMPLKNISLFSQVENKLDYVSWLNDEVDLSADTLWHIGVEVIGKPPFLVAEV